MLTSAARIIHSELKDGKYFIIILHEEDDEIIKKCERAISGEGFVKVKQDSIQDYNVYVFLKTACPKHYSNQEIY